MPGCVVMEGKVARDSADLTSSIGPVLQAVLPKMHLFASLSVFFFN
jgi:hypothetical protein